MPRLARKSFETSFFHVIVQGINKEYIFKNNDYIEKYFRLFFNKLNNYNVKIIAYCIMNNHAHVLLYAESIEEMSKYMKSVNTAYARYYNRNENRVGFVFRNRYKSEPIYSQEHLLNCISYIHNNPVKANIVKHVNEYRYSSYNDYIYKKGIATTEILKIIFGTANNYIDMYKEIHKKDYQFEDYTEDVDYKTKLEKLKTINVEEIKQDEEKLREAIKKLVIEEKIPIIKISEILKINRYKVSRMIKGE